MRVNFTDTRIRRIVGLILAAAAAVPVAATAQSTPRAQVAPAESKLEEIVVTAQKREEDVQDVPVSVSVLRATDLEVLTVGTPDVQILSGRVPSLIMESSFGRAFPRFYIRGLGNTDFDLNASQPVSMLLDEVVLENPVVKGIPLFDLDRVEVLRGPQGTLFGRNTPAGVVKFETVKPSQESSSYVRASYGTYDTLDFNFGIGGALTKTLSARFSGLYQSQNDWVDNLYEPGPEDTLGGYETQAYRLQFLWEPSQRFDALVNIHGWDLDGTARIFRANIIEPGTNNLVDGFDQEVVYQDGRNKQEIHGFGGLFRMDYQFESATLTSITGYESIDDMYSRGDIDGGYGAVFAPPYGPGFIPFSSESADGLPSLDQWTEELRLASTTGETFDWLLGVFYFNEDLQVDSFGYDSLGGGAADGYAWQTQEAESWAGFGSIGIALSDLWDARAGLRYSHDDKDFMAQRVTAPFIQTLQYGSGPTVVIPVYVDDSFWSWDLSLTYKPSNWVNIYGRAATSYRAPSIQGRTLWCPDVDGTDPATNCVSVADTEDILSFELGLKSILAEQRLRLNLTGYWYNVNNQQITAVGGQYNTATLLNADTTEGYGAEMDMEWTPSGYFLATVGASYNPTEIQDPNLTVAPCAGGCTVTDPIIGGLAYVDGNPLPNAPEWIFNGIVTLQSSPVYKHLFATLDWAYYSEKNFFIYESKEFKDDSLEFGLRIGYAFSNMKYELALFGRNIFDAEIMQGGIDFNNLTAYTNTPRIIGMEFIAHF